MARIEIYTKAFCPYCARALALLSSKGAKVEETDITLDRHARDAMIERADGRTTVPQIFIDGRHIGGSDDLAALDRAGELDPPAGGMIVFDLRCDGGHVFEAWFASSAAFEEQRDRRLVACPMCGDSAVAKAVMAPRVAAKGNAVSTPDRLKAVLAEIASAQGKALKDSRWVGRRFADEARAMHDGEVEHATIHGQATPDEARALVEDGVPVAPLLVPVTPPETLN